MSVATAVTFEVATPQIVEVPESPRANRLGLGAHRRRRLVRARFGLGSKAGHNARFGLSPPGAKATMPDLVVPARIFGLAFGVAVAAAGWWRINRDFSQRGMKWVVAVTIVVVAFSFLCWSVTGKSTIPLIFSSDGLFGQTIFLAVPLILGALAGVMCERSGVINVAIEGQMLVGAFAGAMIGTISKSAAIGIIGGMLAGPLIAAFWPCSHHVPRQPGRTRRGAELACAWVDRLPL